MIDFQSGENRHALGVGLTREERLGLRERLYPLLRRLVLRFTSGESSSVPVETAQALLESLLFCLEQGLQADEQDWRALLSEAPEEIYAAGLRRLEDKLAYGERLWQAVCANLPPVENQSMRDTLRSIGGFWRRYDCRYAAQEVPCDIDYQLCIPVPESLQGVDYVNAYLERLAVENRLLRCFSSHVLEPVLESYCRDYRGLLINLYEPAATNALGRVLLGETLDTLIISPEQCEGLEGQLTHLSRTGLEELMSRTAERLSDQLGLGDRRERAYLRACAGNLAPRIALVRDTGGLSGIFLTGEP
ncbi:MAG: DUF6179 domain-containing protein [Candidatus Onthomonas sp.]